MTSGGWHRGDGRRRAEQAGNPRDGIRQARPGKRGFITRTDTANLPGFESAFQQADENNDGRLSQDEFARAWAIYSLQP